MANLKPHKFTREDQIKGGKQSKIIRLNTNKVNRSIQDYMDGTAAFEGASFVDDLLAVSPKERMQFLIAYLPFEKPKLQAIEQIVAVSRSEKSKEEIEQEIFNILKVS